MGCGDSATDTPEGYYEAFSNKQCQQYFECDLGDGDAPLDRATYSESQCSVFSGPLSARYKAYLADGSVRYDATAAAACLASFSTLCVGGDAPECDRVFVGTVTVGGGCRSSVQCASGVCDFAGGSCGICIATVADGQACGAIGVYCGPNSYCDYAALNPTCAPDGASSTSTQVEFGASCASTATSDRYCAPHLYCDTTEHCAERLVAGLLCDPDVDACASGTVCEDDGTDYRCRTAVKTRTVGADCGLVGTQYVICDASARLYCGDNDVCVRLAGNGEVGSECQSELDCRNHKCVTDASVGICVAGNLSNGSVCSDSIECQSGNCDYSSAIFVCATVNTCR